MAKSSYVETINIQQIDTNDKKINVNCGICKRETKHLILSHIHLSGDVGDIIYHGNVYYWYDTYQIVQCQGCEHISFRKTHSNSEDVEYGDEGPEPIEYETIFPNPEATREPIEDNYLLPSKLKKIYEETLSTLNSMQSVLTGIGIRAIVETVCKDKNANGNNLFDKINDLRTQGVLTQDGANILHKLRTLGNDAAHEVKPHNSAQLGLALDVIDHLLIGVYILPHHAREKFQ